MDLVLIFAAQSAFVGRINDAAIRGGCRHLVKPRVRVRDVVLTEDGKLKLCFRVITRELVVSFSLGDNEGHVS
jgi:hypothetical protein